MILDSGSVKLRCAFSEGFASSGFSPLASAFSLASFSNSSLALPIFSRRFSFSTVSSSFFSASSSRAASRSRSARFFGSFSSSGSSAPRRPLP